jgi:hypothetical protein
MKTKVVGYIGMVLGWLFLAVPLIAHHGTGVSYDMKKVTTLKGVVTRFAFANPHSQLYFDVTDDQGNVTHWAAEMRAPGNLLAEGYTRRGLMEKLAPGTPITVTGNPSKSGAPACRWLLPVQPRWGHRQRQPGRRRCKAIIKGRHGRGPSAMLPVSNSRRQRTWEAECVIAW